MKVLFDNEVIIKVSKRDGQAISRQWFDKPNERVIISNHDVPYLCVDLSRIVAIY